LRSITTGKHVTLPSPIEASKRTRRAGLLHLLSLRGLAADTLLVLLYVVLSRSFIGDEAKLGVKIGPLPVFVTDVTLLILIVLNLYKRSGRLLDWVFGGSGAGEAGRAVWALFLMALVYFLLAFRQYTLFALRDMAIFGYSVFFPLTCFALPRRSMAAKLVRYFIYATCVGAALFELQSLSGLKIFNLYEIDLGVVGHDVISRLSAGNLGADLGAALAGLSVYLVIERQHRLFHAGAIILCLVALFQLLDRTSLLGFAAAAGAIFVLGVGRARVYLTVVGAVLLALLLLSAEGDLPIPGGQRLHNVWQGLSSGANFQNDPDAQFRLHRWQSTLRVWMSSPVFGVGFGAPIQLDTWGVANGAKGAAERGSLGAFNVGMPHNSFLVVLARTGLMGLGLLCFAWFGTINRTIKLVRRGIFDADQVASAAALIAMILTAALNLFFERPMLCAPFWIMLAASFKLTESFQRQPSTTTSRGVGRRPVAGGGRVLADIRRRTARERIAGAWQARWKGEQG
jgi:O-antigen ligase